MGRKSILLCACAVFLLACGDDSSEGLYAWGGADPAPSDEPSDGDVADATPDGVNGSDGTSPGEPEPVPAPEPQPEPPPEPEPEGPIPVESAPNCQAYCSGLMQKIQTVGTTIADYDCYVANEGSPPAFDLDCLFNADTPSYELCLSCFTGDPDGDESCAQLVSACL